VAVSFIDWLGDGFIALCGCVPHLESG
jgi:hypothetical protein